MASGLLLADGEARSGAPPAGALRALSGGHRGGTTTGPPGVGRRPGGSRGLRPPGVAPRRRCRGPRPRRRRRPRARRVPRRASWCLRRRPGRLRTRGSVDHAHRAAGGADARGGAERLGVRATSRARSLLAAARQLAEDPVQLSDIARLQGRIEVNLGSATDAHRIFVEAAHASTRSTRPEPWRWRSPRPSCAPTAPTAARRWTAGDIHVDGRRRRLGPNRVPQADARRDDPGRRGRLVRGRRRAGPRLAPATRSTTSTYSATWATPHCSSATTRPNGLLRPRLSRAREAARSWWSSTPCSGCASGTCGRRLGGGPQQRRGGALARHGAWGSAP